MKIESPAFTAADVQAFMDELLEVDRDQLVGRLEAVAARLDELAPRLESAAAGAPEGWTAHETLAHMAVLSKFYGVLTYRIGSGKMGEFNLLEFVNMRDLAGVEAAKQPVGELVQAVRENVARSVEYIRSAPVGDLARRARTGMARDLTAEEVARLPLCAHLEQHLGQLAAAL